MKLKPFFCYFGGKWRAAGKYPKPAYNHIIEPFAGAAGYALNYSDCDVTLLDADPIIAGLWSYLIRVSREEILSLPTTLEHVDDIKGPEEARWLVGFWLNKGSSTPKLQPSSRMKSGLRPKSHWGTEIRERIAQQVGRIRHWKAVHAPYAYALDTEATWFVDPPYEKAGRGYRHKFSDFGALAEWCHTRKGQVIVCEAAGATWLPFEPLARIKASSVHGHSDEVVWTRTVSAAKVEVA